MLQNYFFLNRFLLEVKSILVDFKIIEIFSQEKSKLVIVTSKNSNLYFLELSVVPGNAFINLRKNYSRAKKNTVNFFDDVIGEQINSMEIASDDRVLKIICTNSNIFFTIRGKFTNIFHSDKDSNLRAFKSVPDKELLNLKSELNSKIFLEGWNSFEIQQDDGDDLIANVRKKYPFLGSEIVKEVKARINEYDRDTIINSFYEVLNEVKNAKPCVFINEPEQDVHLGFHNFKSFPFTEKKIFDSTVEAINFVLSKRHYLVNRHSKLKIINNYLEREIKKVSNKINNLQGVIDRGSKEAIYNKYGNLLLSNIGEIKSRLTSILVDDIFTNGRKIKITLNPALSTQKNVDHYFDKSRSEKISFTKNIQLLEKAKKDFQRLQQIYNSLIDLESSKDLDVLMNKLKIKQPAESDTKEDLGSKFKRYIIDNKYEVFVGKDSKNNDLLTTRFAKQNDYWFHSRGSSGSHVILRVENTKEAIPKTILKKTAALAAYHSKAKTAGVVPVAYTFKKYVVKKKGDPIGTVHLLKENVLLVKPEIPDGSEYLMND